MPSDESQAVTFLGMVMDRTTRWNFLCEAINAALLGIFVGIVNPFTLPLAVRLGAGPIAVWMITAAPFIGNIFSPIWAGLSYNTRKLPWVVWANVIWRGGVGLVGFLTNPAAIAGTWLFANVANASCNTAYGALVQRIFPARIRGRLMGYIRLAQAAAMLPTTLVAGRLLDKYGPRSLYSVAGAMGLLAIFIYSFTKEPARAPAPSGPLARPNPAEGLKQAVTDRPFRAFLIASILFHGGALVASPLYAVYQVRQMALSSAQISYLALAWNVAWLVAYGVWGRVIDRRGPRTVVIGAALFYLGMPLAYGLAGGTFALIALGSLCQGVADAALDLGGWNLILAANPEKVGSYTAAYMMVTAVRGALGPLLGSWLLGVAGFESTFLAAAVLVFGGLAAFAVGKKR